jgi:adenylate cyclase
MAEERAKRRLAAILAADVVGYSRLIEADEAGTLTALKARRTEILRPLISTHHGRIVKVMGDGVLVEFGSAVNAVTCAVELQEAMETANADLSEDKRIVLRIGINLGDVMVEGSDLYGDGVNIAARLEALADAGSVFISQTVFSHVKGKTNFGFEDLGERSLKNMAELVRVYRLSGAATRTIGTTTANGDLPSKPSIAVLPFTNMSGDPEQNYFSDGITEDIITELSRFHDLLVIARNSSFQYRGKNIDVRRAGRELGVDFIIEGSIRTSANRLRITAQLVDAATGNHVWAERYDREIQDVFAIQEEMARSIAATVGGRVEAVRTERAVRRDLAAIKAYDLVLRAKALAHTFSKRANEQARELAKRAIEIDPSNAKAYSYVGYTHMIEYVAHWVADRANSLAQAYEFGREAVALDGTDIEVLWKFGQVLLIRGEFEEAHAQFLKALEVNPNDSVARCQYGLYLDCIGQHERAIEEYELAKRRNPFDPSGGTAWLRGIAYFGARRYAEAIATLNQVNDPIPEIHGWLAASYAHAGRVGEARTKLEAFLRETERDMVIFPGRRLKDWQAYWRGAAWYKDQSDFDHLFDGLRKAGMAD